MIDNGSCRQLANFNGPPLKFGSLSSDTANMSNASELLKFFGDASKVFFEALHDSDLMERILELSIQATNADRGTIYFDHEFEIDKEMKHLQFYIATGVKRGSIVINTKQGIAGYAFTKRQPYICNDTSNDPHFFPGIDMKTGYETKSVLAVPLYWRDNRVIGVLQVLNKKEGEFDKNDQALLEAISILASVAIENYEIKQQNIASENANEYRKNIWRKSISSVSLKSGNDQLQKIYDHIKDFAQSDSNIMITGESGTGKEVIARLIHHNSRRNEGPFIAINCTAIPESLFEAELFGVAKGAATGTIARPGQIELAHHGTLFLDEIGEMPIDMQAKLLRVLQERKVHRLGSTESPKQVDFRLVCATNKSLEKQIEMEKFREDLYYRVNVVQFYLPPLRDRISDLAELVQSILLQLHQKRGWKLKKISTEALDKLKTHRWPGNIRELENKIESAYLEASQSTEILAEHIHLKSANAPSLSIVPKSEDFFEQFKNLSLKEARERFEQEFIQRAINSAEGNKSEAARRLGVSREGLRKILTKTAA